MTFHRKQVIYSYAGLQSRDFRIADWSTVTVPTENRAKPGSHATNFPHATDSAHNACTYLYN